VGKRKAIVLGPTDGLGLGSRGPDFFFLFFLCEEVGKGMVEGEVKEEEVEEGFKGTYE